MVVIPYMPRLRAVNLRYQIHSTSMGSLQALGHMLGAYLLSGLALSYGLVTSISYLQRLLQIR